MLTSNDFRDTSLLSVAISYDWQTSSHSAQLCVVGADGLPRRYVVSKLSNYSIADDFSVAHIAQCTLLTTPGRVYLSLEPYAEGQESDKDSFVFVGQAIGVC